MTLEPRRHRGDTHMASELWDIWSDRLIENVKKTIKGKNEKEA